MPAIRIKTKINEVRDQIAQCVIGIQGEASWPATAPTEAATQTAHDDLEAAIISVESLEAQLKVARQDRDNKRDAARTIVKRIDEVTSGLYTPTGAQKNNFGIPPESEGGSSDPIVQPIIKKVSDGNDAGSIYLDWDSQGGVNAYQVEWYADSALTQLVGTATASASEYTIGGLTTGSQYWMRVRGVRGADNGPWSDIATRVACV